MNAGVHHRQRVKLLVDLVGMINFPFKCMLTIYKIRICWKYDFIWFQITNFLRMENCSTLQIPSVTLLQEPELPELHWWGHRVETLEEHERCPIHLVSKACIGGFNSQKKDVDILSYWVILNLKIWWEDCGLCLGHVTWQRSKGWSDSLNGAWGFVNGLIQWFNHLQICSKFFHVVKKSLDAFFRCSSAFTPFCSPSFATRKLGTSSFCLRRKLHFQALERGRAIHSLWDRH